MLKSLLIIESLQSSLNYSKVNYPPLTMLFFLNIFLDYLGYLSERITSTTTCIRYKRYTTQKYFYWGDHKEENHTNFLRIVRRSKRVIRNIQQLSTCLPLTVSLSLMRNQECEVCINEGECLPINTFHVTDQIHDWGRLVSLTGLNSP